MFRMQETLGRKFLRNAIVQSSLFIWEELSGHEEEFLLGRYEEGCRLMGEAMFEQPIGKSRTLETKWVTSAFRYSSMEVGFYFYGFYRRDAKI